MSDHGDNTPPEEKSRKQSRSGKVVPINQGPPELDDGYLLGVAPWDAKTVIHARDIVGRPQKANWLIKGLFSKQELIVLFGESQSYKSLLALEMATCISTGTPWRGHKVTQGAVLYVLGEGAGPGFQRRLEAYQIANKMRFANSQLYVREVPLWLPRQTAALLKEIEALQQQEGVTFSLVILDTLARTLEGNENSAEDFAKYQMACDAIKIRLKAAVLIVHHSGHVEKGRPKGTYALIGSPDVLIQAERIANEKATKMLFLKIKDGETPEPKVFRLAAVELYHDEEGELITSVVLIEDKSYVLPKKKNRPQGINENLVVDLLEQMLEQDGPPKVADLQREFQKKRDDLSSRSSKRTFYRSLGDLKDKGLITESADYYINFSAEFDY